MKKLTFILFAFINTFLFAQQGKSTIAILNIDTEGISETPEQVGNFVRLEVDKLNIYEVMDKYDVAYLIEKNGLNIQNCYGKICLQEVGSKLGVDKMLTGNIEAFGGQIVITLKVINLKNNTVEKNTVQEFLFIPKELQNMLKISINILFDLENEQQLVKELTKKQALPSEINITNNKNSIKANGTRVGFTLFTGEAAKVLGNKKIEGGFNAAPIMFQFGYQFEKQYLNEGRLQALFEFVPVMTGLEQGLFIPSFTFMNGLRDNKTGIEFSFGPTFSAIRTAKGYYDANNNWQLETYNSSNSHTIEERLDSRGKVKLKPNFIFAFGKTWTSGNLNVPMNIFVIPQKDNFRFGLSVGYNSVKHKK